jgi:hypothetical protein
MDGHTSWVKNLRATTKEPDLPMTITFGSSA